MKEGLKRELLDIIKKKKLLHRAPGYNQSNGHDLELKLTLYYGWKRRPSPTLKGLIFPPQFSCKAIFSEKLQWSYITCVILYVGRVAQIDFAMAVTLIEFHIY